MNDKYCLITFKSITYAIQFEKIIKENNISIKLIPVPRSISASCGMCGKFEIEKKQLILDICTKNNIKFEDVFEFNI